MSSFDNNGQVHMFTHDDGTSSPNVNKGGKGGKPFGSGNSISPVTVKQLGQAVQIGEQYKLDNFELNLITLVGAVLKENKQTTHWEFQIDDGTGMIDAKLFIDTDEAQTNHLANQLRDVVAGTYVRVIGKLQVFNKEKSFVALKIMPIKDFNEVTFHLLDVAHVHLSRVHGHLGAPVSDGTAYTNNTTQYNRGGYVNPRSNNDNVPGQFDDVQRAILSILKDNNHFQEGVEVPYPIDVFVIRIEFSIDQRRHVLHVLGNTFQRHDILHALDFLMNEGHIYTGMDDNHIKAS